MLPDLSRRLSGMENEHGKGQAMICNTPMQLKSQAVHDATLDFSQAGDVSCIGVVQM